jgi:hypothetical protein
MVFSNKMAIELESPTLRHQLSYLVANKRKPL